MRHTRAVLLLTTMAAALVFAGGSALAITKQCRTEIECIGTPEGDELLGTGGSDWMFGRGAGDVLEGFGEWSNNVIDDVYNDEAAGADGNPAADFIRRQGGKEEVFAAGATTVSR